MRVNIPQLHALFITLWHMLLFMLTVHSCRKKEKQSINFKPQEMQERRISEAEDNDYQDFAYSNPSMEVDEMDSSPSTSNQDIERGVEAEDEADELPSKIDVVSIITYETEPPTDPNEGEEFTTFKGADEAQDATGEDETFMVDDKGVNTVNGDLA